MINISLIQQIEAEKTLKSRWFSVGICKYKLGYKSHDLLSLHWWKIYLKENPLQDLFSSVNAVISTNERIEFITDHMTYNLAYT